MTQQTLSTTRPSRRQVLGRSIVSVVVLVSGLWAGVLGMQAWQAHQAVKAPTVVRKPTTPNTRQAAEGTDATPLPLHSLAEYKVAADVPRALLIDKLSIAARILPMDLNPDNSIQAPININDSGWYTGSAKPGVNGAMVIDGHSSASGTVRQGLFSSIDKLVEGDILTVQKGDGSELHYRVVARETVALTAIDMHKVLQPYGGASQGLNLITCSGQWTKDNKTLDHRTVVYAERI